METYSSPSAWASVRAASSTADVAARRHGLGHCAPARGRQGDEGRTHLAAERGTVGADGVEHAGRDALLSEQRLQQVHRLELGVAGGRRRLDGVAEGFLGLGGELRVHRSSGRASERPAGHAPWATIPTGSTSADLSLFRSTLARPPVWRPMTADCGVARSTPRSPRARSAGSRVRTLPARSPRARSDLVREVRPGGRRRDGGGDGAAPAGDRDPAVDLARSPHGRRRPLPCRTACRTGGRATGRAACRAAGGAARRAGTGLDSPHAAPAA